MRKPLFDNFFDNFTHSFAAARQLLQKAHDQGNLIEGLVLYASLIDALLRNIIAIEASRKISVAKGEIKFGGFILDSAFFQHDESNWFSERQIYDMALENNVINKAEHELLNELYSFRNRIIHRFIISDVAYSDLEHPLLKYEEIYWRLYGKLEAIEQPPASIPGVEEKAIKMGILRKIIRSRQTIEGIAEKTGQPYEDVEETMEFAAKQDLLIRCKECHHIRATHIDTPNLTDADRDKTMEQLSKKCTLKECECQIFTPDRDGSITGTN